MLKKFLRSTTLCSAILSTTLLTAASQPKPFNRPLVFEPNQGQVSSQVSWTAQGAGYRFYMTPAGGSIVLAEPAPAPSSLPKTPPSVNPSESSLSVVRMKLNGGNPWTDVQGLQPTGGVSNYLIGNNRKAWHTGIPHYERLRVASVYDGIDLVLYGRGRDLEYDFVVAPGADPKQIRVSFEGAKGMRIDSKTGDLVVTTATGSELRHVRPSVYQQVGDQRVEVAGEYKMMSDGQAGFSLAQYDPRRALVIDPTVAFTTFMMGNGDDDATGIAVDAAGNSYFTGHTVSTDFPITEGGRPSKACSTISGQTVCPPSIFVTKLSPTGQVLASTVLGGSGVDLANGIAVDSSGVYITGTTTSQDFSADRLYAYGSWNAFVAKITFDLSTEYYCIAFGGGDTNPNFNFNVGNAIALDSSHAAYVAGDTWSIDFPTSKYFSTTLNPKQKASGGGQDAFVVKVDPWGFLNEGYSTYLGGSGDDSANGIAVDSTGDAYVTGVTSSTDFPTNGAPSIGSPFGGGTTAFVTKLVADGSSSVFSIYLGGTMDAYHTAPFDQGNAIALNATNEVYVTGWTCSQNFPVTYAGAQTTQPTNCFISQQGLLSPAAFVVKLSHLGTMLFATYLGGIGGAAHGTSIAVNNAQEVYVAGDTATSYGFPLAPQMALNPTAGFLTKFSPDLHTVRSTTFLGALITGIVARQTVSRVAVLQLGTTIYTTGDRYRPGTSNVDAFVVKLSDPAVVVVGPIGTVPVAASSTATAPTAPAPVATAPIVSRQAALSVQ
ncbi:MAG: SBBP repeat-containing protein [Terriglobales bacterium]